jgi:hypothetical protein
LTGAANLSGPQAGVHISSTGVLTIEARARDGSSVQVTYNPTAVQPSASPFSITARVGAHTASNTFVNSDLVTSTVNPLGAGTNPRSGAITIYGDGNTPPRVDVIQVFALRPQAGAAQFEYARVLQYGYVANSLSPTSEVLGSYSVFGFPTDAARMPAAGSATWQGGAVGSYTGASGTYDFVGDASLAANFGSGAISGSLSNFSYTNGTSLITPANRIDAFTFNGAIAGSTFSGAANVDFAVSSDLNTALQGQFYGPSNGPPVEAGAAFAGQDSTQFIYGALVVGQTP